MNIFMEMARTPVFTIEDVNRRYKNTNSARSAVKRMMAHGQALKIRNNLYTCISAETGSPIANRFQIASAITDTSYVSHHSAMEYYGITDQVFYDVYVSSEMRFHEFEFDGYTYHFVKSRLIDGICNIEYSGGVRVTDRERTIADSLKDMDKISGLEEVLTCIGSMQLINEEKLLHYLNKYGNQFLYQKAGLLLSIYRESLGLSDSFFANCLSHVGKSKRYLTSDKTDCRYDPLWKLVVPSILMNLKNGSLGIRYQIGN